MRQVTVKKIAFNGKWVEFWINEHLGIDKSTDEWQLCMKRGDFDVLISGEEDIIMSEGVSGRILSIKLDENGFSYKVTGLIPYISDEDYFKGIIKSIGAKGFSQADDDVALYKRLKELNIDEDFYYEDLPSKLIIVIEQYYENKKMEN